MKVDIRRVGDAWFPVELLVTLKDGHKILFKPAGIKEGAVEYQATNDTNNQQWTERWPLNERWKKFKFTTAAEIRVVQLDPDNKVQLDANLTNNSKTATPAIGAAVRWTAGLTFWLQALLQTLAALS
jgi:hypothetical protein